MPTLSQHQSNRTTKLLLIGDSGSGKSGALASLAAAGYNLRILDFDNGLDVLKSYLTNPKSTYVQANPKAADSVQFVTLTDEMKQAQGRIFPIKATVWQRAMNLLEKWEEGEVKLGKITTWGQQDVLVIDSLTRLSEAALWFHLSMNGWLMATRTSNEGRRDIGVAQNLIRSLLSMLYDDSVKCNVIVISHITQVTDSGQAPLPGEAGIVKGYPSSIGRALSPHIPEYFNAVLFAEVVGSGPGAKHKLHTRSRGIVPAKSAAPLSVAAEYPIETGLADYFKAVRGG